MWWRCWDLHAWKFLALKQICQALQVSCTTLDNNRPHNACMSLDSHLGGANNQSVFPKQTLADLSCAVDVACTMSRRSWEGVHLAVLTSGPDSEVHQRLVSALTCHKRRCTLQAVHSTFAQSWSKKLTCFSTRSTQQAG